MSRWDGKYDDKADELHPDVKKKFIAADKKYFSLSGGGHLQINSALRDARKQADLYVKKKFYGIGNPANKPGYSLHNYGIAVDMIMGPVGSNREKWTTTALTKNGWERTALPKERWHFDCNSVPAHAAAVTKRNKMLGRNGLIIKWFNAAKGHHEGKKKYLTMEEKIKASETELQQFREQGTVLISEIETMQKTLKREEDVLNDKIARFNRDLGHLREEKTRLDELAGEFDALKIQYDAKRQEGLRLVGQAKALQAQHKALLNRDSQLVDEYNDLVSQYNDSTSSSERASLRRQIDAKKVEIDENRDQLQAKREELDRKVAEIKRHRPEFESIKEQTEEALTKAKQQLNIVNDMEKALDDYRAEVESEQAAFNKKFQAYQDKMTNLEKLAAKIKGKDEALGMAKSTAAEQLQAYKASAVEEKKYLDKLVEELNKFTRANTTPSPASAVATTSASPSSATSLTDTTVDELDLALLCITSEPAMESFNEEIFAEIPTIDLSTALEGPAKHLDIQDSAFMQKLPSIASTSVSTTTRRLGLFNKTTRHPVNEHDAQPQFTGEAPGSSSC